MTQKLVLVAYGSKRGGTAEIAQWIGDELRGEHLLVEIRPAAKVGAVVAYDAVILGGAFYSGRWHRDARRFARRFARSLRERPVWLFGSGPLDRSAEQPALPKIPGVPNMLRSAGEVGARGYAVFGGRLSPDARGFPASAMARKMAGDYRDQEQIRSWAKKIAAEIG